MNTSRRVFIAGANGFIGRALSVWLNANGIRVSGADRRQIIGFPSVLPVDLLDQAAVIELLRRTTPDIIFHTVGAIGVTDEAVLEQVHVATTQTLLLAARAACPLARIVIFGSAAEYGTHHLLTDSIAEDTVPYPDSPYGRSKLKQSELARAMGRELDLDVVCIRLFNTLGPGQSSQLVAGALVQRLAQVLAHNDHQLDVYDSDSRRDYLDVRDIARLVWQTALQIDRNPNRLPIQIASGEGTTVRDLIQELLRVSVSSVEINWLAGAIATASVGKPATLRRVLGAEPIRQINLRDSLRDMWTWQIQSNSNGDSA